MDSYRWLCRLSFLVSRPGSERSGRKRARVFFVRKTDTREMTPFLFLLRFTAECSILTFLAFPVRPVREEPVPSINVLLFCHNEYFISTRFISVSQFQKKLKQCVSYLLSLLLNSARTWELWRIRTCFSTTTCRVSILTMVRNERYPPSICTSGAKWQILSISSFRSRFDRSKHFS